MLVDDYVHSAHIFISCSKTCVSQLYLCKQSFAFQLLQCIILFQYQVIQGRISQKLFQTRFCITILYKKLQIYNIALIAIKIVCEIYGIWNIYTISIWNIFIYTPPPIPLFVTKFVNTSTSAIYSLCSTILNVLFLKTYFWSQYQVQVIAFYKQHLFIIPYRTLAKWKFRR